MRLQLLILAMSSVVVLTGALPTTASDLDPTAKAIAVIDDFEDGDLDGWAEPTGSCTAVNTGLTGANGSSRSLRVEGDCGHYFGPWFDLVNFQATGVTFWVRSSSASLYDAYVVLGDDNVAINDGAVFFLASATGSFVLVGPNSDTYQLAPYVADQWYRVDLTLDWVGKTVDVFIDGVPRQYNVPFRSPGTTTLTQFHFYNYSNSTAWLDYIVMSSPPPSPDLFANGFESADTTAWSSTVPTAPTRLVLFDGGSIRGAIGGRSGADVLCGQAAQTATGIPVSATTRAFLTVGEFDEIRDFPSVYGVPTNRPVTGPNWNVIADDWADLLDGSIDQTLLDAGTLTAEFWYSGSYSDGSEAPTTCSGWTDGSTYFDGRYGRNIMTEARWISAGAATCGSATYHVLCLAWR